MTLLSGVRLGPYQIVGLLGSGGMGTVYRARDTRLGRTVAIKLLQDALGSDRARSRLLREAQNASALNHPNICTIYEVGDAAGQPFIAMEFVDGLPLSEAIPHDGLSAERVVELGIQIADAVVHAHDHGVVHRDLKPSNVVVTAEGRVKVLDFGLATRAWHEDAAHAPTVPLTQAGAIAGTIAYMPPEVLQGQVGDVRSDIWSLGAMLYQLTTGGLPFRGRTEFELSSQILRESPPPISAHVPSGLTTTIQRCLTKDPGQRYQRAGEVRAALQACISPTSAPTFTHARRTPVLAALAGLAALVAYASFFGERALAVRTIAVVPFVNTGTNPDTEYVSDGITESVINSLARLPAATLKVIAFSSVLRYKGREIDPQAIGNALGVEAIVVGRVAHHPEMLRVSAELVNVRDESRMWGATYTTNMVDLVATQQDIAVNISDNLRLRLSDELKERLTPKQAPRNVEAYQHYLKGRHVLNKYSEEGWTKAIDYFRLALEIDPTYAPAWSGLADSYYQLSSLVLLPAEAIPKARAAALRALEIDETLAEAHASLGMIKSQYDWDRAGAEQEFRRAIELNPSSATARHWLGQYHLFNGRFNEALVELRRAQELDPFSLAIALWAVLPLPGLTRYDEALRELQQIMEMHPDAPIVRSYFYDVRAESYLRQGMLDEAVADFVRGYEMNLVTGGGPEAMAVLTDAYEALGIDGFWRKELELAEAHYQKSVELASTQSPARYVTPYKLAGVYARVNDKDRAFALLEQCYEHRDENVLWIKAESLRPGSPWQSLAADPRFVDLLGRLGFPR